MMPGMLKGQPEQQQNPKVIETTPRTRPLKAMGLGEVEGAPGSEADGKEEESGAGMELAGGGTGDPSRGSGNPGVERAASSP